MNGRSYGAEMGYNISMDQNPADWVKRLRVDALSLTAGYRNMSRVFIKDKVQADYAGVGLMFRFGKKYNANKNHTFIN